MEGDSFTQPAVPGPLVHESQERYRAQWKRSIQAVVAHQYSTATHANKAIGQPGGEISRASSGSVRGSKSVAAQQRDGFARELACARNENNKLLRKIEDLQALLRESRLQASRLSQDINERQHDERARAAASHIAELTSALEAKQLELHNAKGHIETLVQERKNLMTQVASEEASAAQARDRINAIESELVELARELETAQHDKTKYANDLSALHYELDEAMSRMEELQSAVSQHDEDRANWQTELALLESQHSEVENRRFDAEMQAVSLQSALSALQTELNDQKEKEQRYKTRNAEYSTQNDALKATLDKTLAKLSSLEDEHGHLVNKRAELEESLNSAMAKLSTCEGLAQELEDEKLAQNATKAALTSARDRVAKLESALSEAKRAQHTSAEEAERLTQQLAEALRVNGQMRAAIGNESEALTAQQKLVNELQIRNAELKARHGRATATYHEEHTRLVAIEKRATDLSTRCCTLEAQRKESERIIRNLNVEIRKLQDERLELAQGFEDEVGLREIMQFKLQSAQFREQSLLAELQEQEKKIEALISAHAQDLQEAQEEALVREEEAKRQLRTQYHCAGEVEEVQLLRADLAQMKVQLQYEEHKTRRLQNQIQDLKGNIRVVVRVRPGVSNALHNMSLSSDTITLLGFQNTCKGLREVAKKYHFDRVFGPSASNQSVCEETEYLVQSALDGHNVCIFAYGQTGSGKTYTMGGADGVSISAINTVMEATARSRDTTSPFEYIVTAESVEIYNEQLRDLLGQSPMLTGPVTGLLTGPISRCGRASLPQCASSSKSFSAMKDCGGVGLKMNDKTRVPELVGTKKVELTSATQAHELFDKAMRARSVAATAANARSSRSHFIFLLHIARHQDLKGSEVQHSVLNLVDLAGSERLSHSKTAGDRLVETTAINSSLSILGNVIKTLASREPARTTERTGEHSRPLEYLTYRDSKLTFLLQGSLSGDSKAMLLATLSPEADHFNETKSTLQFAETASRATVRQG